MPKRRPWLDDPTADEEEAPPPEPCWLCERPLGTLVEWHHPLPKSKGGRERMAVHPICHRTIHAQFTNAQLARIGGDVGTLRAEPVVAKFLNWIADKPADFHAPTRGRER